MKNQKLIIGLLVVIIAVIAVISAFMYMDMNKQEIILPDGYSVENNESGVITYGNNNNGYKIEVKEQENPKGIKKDNMYGTVMKCTVDDKNYTITCYIPVDKTKSVAIDSRHPEVKAHPGKDKVKGYDVYGSAVSNPIIEFSANTPPDIKTLQNMNKTGNLNAYYLQQTWPATYMDAINEINDLDTIDSLERLADRWGVEI